MKKILSMLALAVAIMFWVPTITNAQNPSTFQQSFNSVSTAGCSTTAGTSTNATIAPCGGQGGMFENSLVSVHTISWIVTATVSACTLEIETSSNGSTWVIMTGTTVQTCTATGNYSVSGQTAAFVRVNILTLTTNASGLLQLNYAGSYPLLQTVSCSFTGAATSAAVQTVAQTCPVVPSLASATSIFLISSPVPTSLCPPTVEAVTAANTISIYFSVLTAAACTPATGTYVFGVVR